MTDQQQQQQPPLWVAMDEAGDPLINKHTLGPQTWRQIRAAELRAIADRVEDIEPPEYKQYYEDGAQVAISAVAAMLRAEADRAEAGE